jgi:ComF family protein
MPSFAEVLVGVERWLLPPACLLCDGPIPSRQGEALVCDLCRSRWQPVPDPVCPRCGQPSIGDLDCRLCRPWPDGLTTVRSAVWLRGTAREAVHRLKYEGWWRIAEVLAASMGGLAPLTGQVSLIPIPLGARRLRQRGYNQAERIAAAMGQRAARPVRTDLLRRRRETRTQTALTPEARVANVAGAFEAGDAGGLACVLVDDVFTTGATLAEAAAALRRAGAARVEAVTFARAEPPVSLS